MNQALLDRGFDLATRGLKLSEEPSTRSQAGPLLDAACLAFRAAVAAPEVSADLKSFVLSKCHELQLKQQELNKKPLVSEPVLRKPGDWESDTVLHKLHELRNGTQTFLTEEELFHRLNALKSKDVPAADEAQLSDAQKAFIATISDPKLRADVERDLLATAARERKSLD